MTVSRTVINDILGQSGTQAGNIGQQFLGGCVDVDANAVHATLYGEIKRFLEFRLVHIVLILAHTDRLWIDLHQFGQWVEQTSTD